MAPAGRGGLRPYQPSKIQPFVIICLLVTVIVIGFNFWNLTKKNSVLLMQIEKVQSALKRLESDRKSCEMKFEAADEKRKTHEAADSEKEIMLEDTRRLVADLKAEAVVLRHNLNESLKKIEDNESFRSVTENKSKHSCDEKLKELELQVKETWRAEKENMQKEMDEQVNMLKKQLKLQYQETEDLNQAVQHRKQQSNHQDANGVAVDQGFNAVHLQANHQQQGSNAQQTQLEGPETDREHPSDSLGRTVNQPKRGQTLLRQKYRGNSTHHSKKSRFSNFSRFNGTSRKEKANGKVLNNLPPQDNKVFQSNLEQLQLNSNGNKTALHSSKILQDAKIKGEQQKLVLDSTGGDTAQENSRSFQNFDKIAGDENEDKLRFVHSSENSEVVNRRLQAGDIPSHILSSGFSKNKYWDEVSPGLNSAVKNSNKLQQNYEGNPESMQNGANNWESQQRQNNVVDHIRPKYIKDNAERFD